MSCVGCGIYLYETGGVEWSMGCNKISGVEWSMGCDKNSGVERSEGCHKYIGAEWRAVRADIRSVAL